MCSTGSSNYDQEWRGILQTILFIGFVLIGFHLYYYCYTSFRQHNLTFAVLDTFIRNLNQSSGIFGHPFISKLLALFVLGVYTFGNKTRKTLDVTWAVVGRYALIGFMLLMGNGYILHWSTLSVDSRAFGYGITTIVAYLMLIRAGAYANRIIDLKMGDDPFNRDNESFEQEEIMLQNEYSINIPTRYYYKGKTKQGMVNVPNPFRATIVIGTPGSGKSFAVIFQFIRQHLEKGFCMYIYDFKFPDLTKIAYYYACKYRQDSKDFPTFYILDFDHPRSSHRCNPLAAELMTDIVDALEASQTILLNLNKSWIKKQGDFFTESPINFFAAIIWYLKLYQDRKMAEWQAKGREDETAEPKPNYCTFPHAIKMAGLPYSYLFPLLQSEPELNSLLIPFASALEKGAFDQLEGQIASARIPLGRLDSKTLFWLLTGNDFTLDINNPLDPKILCVGNNPKRQDVYGAALGLINSRVLRLVNQKGRRKCSIIVDELPTIYFRGLDNLIATGRSNKVCTTLGVQDLSQLKREYGDREAEALFNTIGNVFSGQVGGETARILSTSFGKNKQIRQNFTFTKDDTNIQFSENMDSLIPESKIANLSQGYFVGKVADNFTERVAQKIFHAELVVDPEMKKEIEAFEKMPLPQLDDLTEDRISNTEFEQVIAENYRQVEADINNLLIEELYRLRDSEEYAHLVEELSFDDAER
ncbi:conjugal transfer protein MobC [Nibrella saemangeumensis]|uniref:Conjugal transfer protein MobC n=1 Tax=Nibrella saemangeumensis TaxID=1084526 RepID=A0ABP8N8B5_9BACT